MAQPAKTEEGKTFTQSETRFMTAFFTNIKSKPDVDWDQVAIDASLKGARCARDRYRQILAKHNCTGSLSATTSPRKKQAGGEEGDGGTPSKVSKRALRKKVVKKKEEEVEDNDGDEEGEGSAPAKAVKKRAPGKKAAEKDEDEKKGDSEEGEKVKDEIKDEDSDTS